MLTPRFSVIIPTLNEEEYIGLCIKSIHRPAHDVEVIIADGGSTDRTLEIAGQLGAKVCHSPKSRGQQCNNGAGHASGDILIFLHADTMLPIGIFSRLAAIFGDDDIKIGTFKLEFNHSHWLLKTLAWISVFDLEIFRFGDSGIAIRKSFFQSLGGFPCQPMFEDMAFLQKARRQTRIRRFPVKIVTSARRFIENGVARQLAQNIILTIRYLLGVSTDKLAAQYESGNKRFSSHWLLMMVRFPEAGRVKSRLAVTIGEAAAVEIYRHCAERLFTAAKGLPQSVEKILYGADIFDHARIVSWAGTNNFKFEPQPGGELGERLEKGFDLAFQRGAVRVIITASDVPGISTAILEKAFDALKDNDIVIGPSPDGGYYLIGSKQPVPWLFHNMNWSTGQVLKDTLSVAKNHGLSTFLLKPLNDIDTQEDWERWLKTSKGSALPSKDRHAALSTAVKREV